MQLSTRRAAACRSPPSATPTSASVRVCDPVCDSHAQGGCATHRASIICPRTRRVIRNRPCPESDDYWQLCGKYGPRNYTYHLESGAVVVDTTSLPEPDGNDGARAPPRFDRGFLRCAAAGSRACPRRRGTAAARSTPLRSHAGPAGNNCKCADHVTDVLSFAAEVDQARHPCPRTAPRVRTPCALGVAALHGARSKSRTPGARLGVRLDQARRLRRAGERRDLVLAVQLDRGAAGAEDSHHRR